MRNRFGRSASALPDELRSLDEELSSIRYEERPSFRPELEAELAREWSRLQIRRRPSFRPLAAAAVVALLREAGVEGPGPDRHLSPEIETTVGLVASGAVLSAVEHQIGALA
ncbi:MAG TPA: hypothetical protein EYQ83_18745 [Acidobacteria bacterium]|nr:hypothetical protein [Acidobacteriota bacterium]